jgi:coenzyme PQQ precursor peptide PqqA
MILPFRPTGLPGNYRSRRCKVAAVHHFRRVQMKWETPQATDLRYGMEITMYIANR